jgi:DNA-binding beta-propeller fold protein YncE
MSGSSCAISSSDWLRSIECTTYAVKGSPFKAGTFPESVAVDPTGKFAYVANPGSANVSGYSIAANGALVPVPGSPFPAALPGPDCVTVDPTGKFAYVTNQGDDSHNVSAYRIAANGALVPVPGRPSLRGSGPAQWLLPRWCLSLRPSLTSKLRRIASI